MTPTPRMQTTIERNYQYTAVTLQWEGRTYLTTMHRDVQASDPEVEMHKRWFANLPVTQS
ncbi:MAG: hypothetical protein AB7Q97_01875 [Gammaproteobacteria bacterium]